MVHDRRTPDRTLTMRVSGQVQDGNLVMYDEQTGSLWLQKTGQALDGQMADSALRELPLGQYQPGVRWDQWVAKHPGTMVLHCDHCLPRPPKPKAQSEPGAPATGRSLP